MRPEYFYFGTIKNIIAAFGILFRDVDYVDDWGNSITVPIHYSPQEKFIEMVQVSADHDDGYETMVTLPRFGFELTSIDYDSSRMLNPMSRMSDAFGTEHKYMYNRVPYNFTFSLYLAVRKFEDGLKIVEQVVPFFTPDLNITIKDKEDFDYSTDIPITLNDLNFQIDWQGGFETKRTIIWNFSFTAKAFLYSNVRQQGRIKETIVKMTNFDFNKVYESLISTVEPRNADRDDSHEIVDEIIEGLPPTKLSFNIQSGTVLSENAIGSALPYTVIDLKTAATGSSMKVVPFPGSIG